jgi:uncharacterized protein (DUF2252 family)
MRCGLVAALVGVGCAGAPIDVREQRVLHALFDDNWTWAAREPALVAFKLTKMQRGPYEWLRGTASLAWRDLMEPGGDRLATSFGDAASSRVLLVGDPHPENLGTFRAADGTMFVDWNDTDGSGYGPFTGDLRRLAAGLVIATDSTIGPELARSAATGYAAQIAALARGERPGATTRGAHPVFDVELDKASTRGMVRYNLDELAPVIDGARVLAFRDLEPIAPDGIFEDRLVPLDVEQSAWAERAIERWRAGRLDDAAATIKLRARRIGSGVASYPALRVNVVLEGPTAAVEDDVFLELKETREGLILRGVPQREVAEWTSPAARAVDTQRRLHARPDGDVWLGSAEVGGLSFKIRDREAFQRGLDHEELEGRDLAELQALAELMGGMLARAHGQARTAEGVTGWTVIAPLLAGREAAFVDELTAHALADVEVITSDYARFEDADLFSLVFPTGAP